MIVWRPVVDHDGAAAGDDDDLPPFGAEQGTGRGRSFGRELPLLVGLAVFIAFLVKTFVAQPFYIPSESMYPQLTRGDRVVVSKLAYHLHHPHRGDVVVFDNPEAGDLGDHSALPVRVVHGLLEAVGLRQPSTDEFIKRVVGLPGDVVEGRNGQVYVNDQPLVEPYLPPGTLTSTFEPFTVPKGMLWVMGDNRGNSRDSRILGPIKQSTVVGRAVARIWPPSRTAFL